MSLFTNAILSQNESKVPPIWFMRQAGRYHSHYQSLRKIHSFVDLCKKPMLAAEVALGPVQDFDFDAAILFSDILFPLEMMGVDLEYTDAHGPKLGKQILTQDEAKKLFEPETVIHQMDFQGEALVETRKKIGNEKGLIGFVGGPFTLLTYAVEGSHRSGLKLVKQHMSDLGELRRKIFEFLKLNIALQLKAGADVVMIFDTSAGELNPIQFREWALKPAQELARSFPKKIGYYSKSTQLHHFIDFPKEFLGFGFDHRWDITDLLASPKGDFFVQGNFDQELLFQKPQDLDKSLKEFLDPFQSLPSSVRRNWVCGLGHGVLPKTPEENVKRFISTVRNFFQ